MIASSAVNGLPSSFLKNVVKIFFIALYILIVKLPIQNHADLTAGVGNLEKNRKTILNCMSNE